MRISFTISLIFFVLSGFSQGKISRTDYIEQFKDISMTEMQRTGIPASITLAQGILESGDGNSRLATRANNHFGIKCHDWKGATIRHDDDEKNECFRKYKNPEESYFDHSEFLVKGMRYSSLFELKPDDYKGWAHGLKKAGYATSPTYAKALIKLIEDNELYKFDDMVIAGNMNTLKSETLLADNVIAGRQIYYNNRVKYILAQEGESLTSLTEDMHLLNWQLPRYNDLSVGAVMEQGDTVYIQPKRNKPHFGLKTHIVKEGETIHSIGQKYAVRDSKLRQRNDLPDNAEPEPGVVLLLRGKLKNDSPTIDYTVPENQNIEENTEEPESEFEIEFDLGD